MTALFLLSRLKNHKKAMAVIFILSIVLPLIVMSFVVSTMIRQTAHRADINAEREAIMARREVIIARNEEMRAANPHFGNAPMGAEAMREALQAENGQTVAETTAEFFDNLPEDYFDPLHERLAILTGSADTAERLEE